MGKIVVLELDGALERQNLQVRLKVGAEGEALSVGEVGILLANPALVACLIQWQQLYRNLAISNRIVPKRVSYGRSANQLKEGQRLAAELLDRMAVWLASESFRPIDTKLRTVLDPSESIRVVLQTETILLRRLPWHCWSFLEDYPQAEIALASPAFKSIRPQWLAAKEKVQILAILGHSKGIDIQQDRQFLERIPQAKVTFLVEPQRQTINDQLWDQPWDILFFAGHSATEGNQGRIYCNPQDSLSLDDFEYGLKQAIAKGLQLAIFNSCDGLGLAHSLEKLQFPQLIVMREPVPDWVAQVFLKQLLQSFTTGHSLYQSVRQARERLQGLEDRFPCASWLPILCQNPAVSPPTWQALVKPNIQKVNPPANAFVPVESSFVYPNRETNQFSIRPRLRLSRYISRQIQISLLVSSVILMLLTGIRHLGWLQPLELKAFDQMMQLRSEEGADPRLLIVEVTDADIAMQRQNQELLQRRSTSAPTLNQLFDVSLSDNSLNRLLKALEPARVIGLDIYRDFSVEPDQMELATRLRTLPGLITVCKAEEFQNAKIPSINSPPEVPLDRVGFSDFIEDSDGILRRHLLGMLPLLQTSNSRCNANLSFSMQIAFHYLRQQGVVAQFTPAGDLQLGEKVFKVLQSHSGGYQGVKPGGSKILLNYRTEAIARRVTLTQVLQNKLNPDYIKNKIVLIGVTASGGNDNWFTPYGASIPKQMPGVMVQAQMVSQLVGAALENRPLLQVWTGWQEGIWIGTWALVGSLVVGCWGGGVRSRALHWSGLIILAVGLLYGLCFSALLRGNWIPFIPSLLALLLSISTMRVHRHYRSRQQTKARSQGLILRH
jgi:CHASE2 domain-containing sensor protein